MARQRLDKILASTGKYSRSEAAAAVRRGEVTVNGVSVRNGAEKVDPDQDAIRVKDTLVEYHKFRYLMMNKPAGVLSASEDKGAPTYNDLLPEEYKKLRLFAAGRLDKASEGLLLLTNDGDYAHRVISPNKNVFKKYYVETEGELTEQDVIAVKEGIELQDFVSKPGKLEILCAGEKSKALIYIREGKFHQVRRMLGSRQKPVLYLKRLAIGSLELEDDLVTGQFRELTPEEAALVFVSKDISFDNK